MNLYDVYSLYDVAPVRGKGAFVYDQKNTEYLDFYGGHAVISIGHAHPHYVRRISEQLTKIGFYSNSVINPLQQELADKLESQSNISGYELFLINSGAEANENALKLASFYNGRKSVLALKNSFHGRTSAAINMTHTGQKHQAPINKGIEVTYAAHDDIEMIINEIKSQQHSAFILEVIQGVGGLDMIDANNLSLIREACSDSSTILIMDEVQCGYGRSGDFFAFEKGGIRPDLITMAKGMGNGFPIGGVLIDAVKMPAIKSRLGTTYGGNHLACAAGIAVLEVMDEEDIMTNVVAQGNVLREELSLLPHVKNIKGRGLMLGLELDFEIKNFRKKLVFDYHLFTGSAANPNLLRLLPPLNIKEKEVDLFISKLKKALHHI